MGVARVPSSNKRPQRRKRSGDLKNRAYDALKQRIIAGVLAPGDFLSERLLAESLGMSKTPVRVALERLELEGFVTVSPQLGVVIRDLSVEEIADQFQIRQALESFALRALSGALDAGQVERLQANLDEQLRAAESNDVARMVELDTAFHMMFCEFLGNREISRVVGQLRDRISVVILRVFQQLGTERLRGSLAEHREIVAAVIDGDGARAAAALERHLEFGKRTLMAPRRD